MYNNIHIDDLLLLGCLPINQSINQSAKGSSLAGISDRVKIKGPRLCFTSRIFLSSHFYGTPLMHISIDYLLGIDSLIFSVHLA
jgi:hypothetical protein